MTLKHAGRDLYSATPAVTPGFCGLITRSTQSNYTLYDKQGGLLLTQIPWGQWGCLTFMTGELLTVVPQMMKIRPIYSNPQLRKMWPIYDNPQSRNLRTIYNNPQSRNMRPIYNNPQSRKLRAIYNNRQVNKI